MVVNFILENFALVMFVLATILICINRFMVGKALSEYEIVYRWIALLPLGLAGIYTFIVHAFYPTMTALNIGWPPSPFQYEIAMANLAIGVLGILSFRARYDFRLATTIASMCWLWGDAVVHINQIIEYNNFSIGNAGSWLWMDILVPLILLLCVTQLKPGKLMLV